MIRRLLETRKPRERILLTAFLWAALLLAAAMLVGALRKSGSTLKIARSEVAVQKSTIAQKDFIEGRLANARNTIDSNKTINAIKLSSSVDALARNAGLNANIASPVRKESDIFNTYTVRMSCKNASLEQLLNFTQSVRKQAPYLAMRRFKMNADQRDPRVLSAEIEIESFELNKAISR